VKKWIIPILAGAALFFALGCTLNSPCAASDLGAPGDLSPAAREVVSLTPSLTWNYPHSGPSPYPYPAGSTGCALSAYQVHLVLAENEFSEYGGTSINQSFTPASPLMPAKLYFWEVRAQSLLANGPWSGYRAFYTGPVCEAASLGVPYLRHPADGETVTELTPGFSWANIAPCLPDSYHIDLSTDPAFSDISLSGDTADRRTNWTPPTPLDNCTTYYWRAASRVGTALSAFSPTWSFNVAVAFCSPVLVIPSLVVPPLTLVPPPTPQTEPTFVTTKNANCREGPSQIYEPLTSVAAGETFPVEGKNEEGTWFFVLLPGRNRCWISAVTGTLIGDPNLIPIIYDLPPTPVIIQAPACHDYGDAATCKADPKGVGPCSWDLKKNRCAP